MKEIQAVYFLGIGGIGMSNLARYFMSKGKKVAGYDRTETPLTKELVKEGAEIHYIDNIKLVPICFLDKASTLIVYTPAMPKDSEELNFFIKEGFQVMKRAQVLGLITQNSKALCCAGTHGKTTTSSMLAHILYQSHLGCNAFLGGILKNYGTNLLLSKASPYTVVEADEYDRSFHWLHPDIALTTSVSPDHLDIYGTEEEYVKSFEHFTSLIQENGTLVIRHGIDIKLQIADSVSTYTYSIDEGDFHAENVRIGNGEIFFDFVTPSHTIHDIQLGVPIKINLENSIGSMAIAHLVGATDDEIKNAIKTYQGAKRRFDFYIKSNDLVFIDDYAHHPDEIAASITSIRELYPNKKLTGVFQPHLYTRTRDFHKEFAQSLSLLDELILLDIYPAREEPIAGITSKIIFDDVTCEKTLCKKEDLLDYLDKKQDIEVLITLGAGDIDKLLTPIKDLLDKRI